MGKVFAGIGIAMGLFVLFAISVFGIYINWVPSGIEWWTEYQATRDQAAEDTYDAQREVEDAARALIVSYESNYADYVDYKALCATNSESAYCSMVVTAKSRTNDAAIRFNEYMLKNSFVWEDNIPSDIDRNLILIN